MTSNPNPFSGDQPPAEDPEFPPDAAAWTQWGWPSQRTDPYASVRAFERHELARATRDGAACGNCGQAAADHLALGRCPDDRHQPGTPYVWEQHHYAREATCA